VTILDIVPHTSQCNNTQLVDRSDLVAKIMTQHDYLFINHPVTITVKGVFASPDGITLQGYVSDKNLNSLRNVLRDELSKAELLMELDKYIVQSAHISLLKFVKPLNGRMLIEKINRLRKVDIGSFTIIDYCLNISARLDKDRTIQKIWEISV
jgi:hypothetical protein